MASGGAAALLWALHAAELQDIPIRYDINEALGKLAGDVNPDNSSTVRIALCVAHDAGMQAAAVQLASDKRLARNRAASCSATGLPSTATRSWWPLRWTATPCQTSGMRAATPRSTWQQPTTEGAHRLCMWGCSCPVVLASSMHAPPCPAQSVVRNIACPEPAIDHHFEHGPNVLGQLSRDCTSRTIALPSGLQCR